MAKKTNCEHRQRFVPKLNASCTTDADHNCLSQSGYFRGVKCCYLYLVGCHLEQTKNKKSLTWWHSRDRKFNILIHPVPEECLGNLKYVSFKRAFKTRQSFL